VARTLTDKQKSLVEAYNEAMQISVDYCRGPWDQFIRLYKLWLGHKPAQLNNTISKVMINYFHQAVQDRLPKLTENVFGSDQLFSLRADTPQAELFVRENEMWLRNLLDEKIRIRETIFPTLQSMLIGGTAYRMPCVHFDKGKPIFSSKPLDFFQVLPSPGGGDINPQDGYTDNALDWLFVVEYWTEEKIKNHKGLDQKEVAAMLSDEEPYGGAAEPEEIEDYRNRFENLGQVNFGTADQWRDRMRRVREGVGGKQRRVVHWFTRDRHVIMGEDTFILRDGKPTTPRNKFPIAKYCMTPDITNFFGVSYLALLEDLLVAQMMNTNFRLDHLAGVMFPTTWVRRDIAQKYPKREFIPRPNDVKYFPQSVKNISEAVWYDRRPDVSPDAFLNEDYMKQMVQKIAGLAETTTSLNNVIGNKTATGVTSILNELSGRPNMESLVIEHMGFRNEVTLLMELSAKHFNKRDSETEFIRFPRDGAGFNFTEVDPEDITDAYTVTTHGTRFLAERNIKFQQLVSLYPYWNQSPIVDQYELARQTAEVGGFLPDVEKAFLPPSAPAPTALASPNAGAGAQGEGQRPGGLASSQDLNQQTDSVANRTAPEPGTGAITQALNV
jgi:hypothetical protein